MQRTAEILCETFQYREKISYYFKHIYLKNNA